MKHYIYILSFLFTSSIFAQNQDLFEEANTYYNDGKFAEAIDNYQAILESGQHSADLYFNLANANYKLNNIAPSIYYYEKALQLAPNDPDIKNNMAFAQNMTIDAIDVIPDAGLSKLLNTTTHKMSFDTWAIVSVSLVFCFVILFLIYYFSYSTGDTHFICYAIGDNPYGPFTYTGRILEPVVGWTSHHSVCKVNEKWYLFYHDSSLSKGVTHLRSVKVAEITHLEDGSIETLKPYNLN